MDDDTPTGQNIGNADKNMHCYWHFKDIRFSTDGAQFSDADPINAVYQMKLFIAALPATSAATDDIRSYDTVLAAAPRRRHSPTVPRDRANFCNQHPMATAAASKLT